MRVQLLLLLSLSRTAAFQNHAIFNPTSPTRAFSLNLFGPNGSSGRIPSSPSDRDGLAIDGIKRAIASPRNNNYPLVECEFPPIQALNKLGDGSLRSAKEVDKANLNFAGKLIRSISPLPLLGPKTWLLTSTTASPSFIASAKSKAPVVHALRDGLPSVARGDICVLVGPSAQNDYDAADRLAAAGVAKAVVVVNGFAKNQKSISPRATMGYFLKPLTYNSQVVGYLTRCYPGKWATIDMVSKEVLGTFDDSSILVRGTNTPDLRESGRLVQKSVDDRAIRARKGL